MRRLIWISAAGLLLLGAGAALAHEGGGTAVKQASATFAAATASNVRTSTCTDANKVTYTATRGRWSGTATGDPSLTGNATIDAQVLVNSAGDGIVSGRLRIDGANHTSAWFAGVVSGGSHISGLAEGHGSADWSRLVANLSADWSSAGGFANGKLGGGTAGGNAVLLTAGGCRPAGAKPETVEAHGTLTLGANNATVTVAGVSCNVPSDLAAQVGKLHTGDRVEIKCTSSAGTNTLTRIERKGDHD